MPLATLVTELMAGRPSVPACIVSIVVKLSPVFPVVRTLELLVCGGVVTQLYN